MIKTKKDHNETKKIYNLLKKYFNVSDLRTSNILYHVDAKNNLINKGFYRDNKKDLINIYNDYFLISFSSDINPAGVGDELKPSVARTYNINFNLYINKRNYRTKTIYQKELGFYLYARDIESLESKLKEKINIFKLQLATFKESKTSF